MIKYLVVLQCSAVQVLGFHSTMLPKEIIILVFKIQHHFETDYWPRISRPKNVLNNFSVSYQDLLEYVGILIIKQGYHGEQTLKKHYKPKC